MQLTGDDAKVLSERWSAGALLKRDVFSTVERGPVSTVSIWPPVMWPSSAPSAVVGGGSEASVPLASAAANIPANSPTLADST